MELGYDSDTDGDLGPSGGAGNVSESSLGLPGQRSSESSGCDTPSSLGNPAYSDNE